jgi:hypothetical protein
VRIAVERIPSLARLALDASRNGPDADVAAFALRDELIGLVRDSSEASWRRLRRGVDELDALTRPRETDVAPTPRRRHRVKR